MPKTPELLTHDVDVNTLSDGRWDYVWDAENRLTTLIARNPVGEPSKIEFQYDAQGRRIQKSVWNTTSPPSGPVLIRRYVYDGWNLVAELEANLTLVQSYLWGTDLSGSLQGAGGVGGLIASRPAAGPARFVAFDGNGNVIALVNGSTGSVDARYEYGPFGENIRTSGSFSKTNPFRFSTKYQGDETDFLYYGYRYYDVRNGRWVSRDPIGENGGMNLYGFVRNELSNTYDVLGLFDTGSQGRTDAVKNRSIIRAEVAILVHNMLASRDNACTKGRAIERKTFKAASTTTVVSMYLTGFFLLGQVAVPLDGKGYYEVDCCDNPGTFGKWEIVIHGSFRDKFDQLLPPALVGGDGWGSLPLTFVGEWVEFYSGSE